MEDKRNYGELYKLGKYEMSFKLLEDHNPKNEMDTFVVSNNRIVCTALKSNDRSLNETWREVIYSFVDLHAAYRCLTEVPFSIELNIVYNLMSWYSSIVWNFEQNDVFESTILEAVSHTLIKVLNICKEVSVISEFEIIDMNFIVTLLKKTLDYMLSLTPVQTLQMLDICTVFSHLVLKKQDQELSDEYLAALDSIMKRKEIIKLHLTSYNIRNDYDEECFKFGLNCINSTSSVDNYQSSLEAFMISVSILASSKNNHKVALKYLCQSEICGNTESYKYIWNYLKAFCHMRLDEYNEAELHLSYISRLPMDNRRKFYYFLLLGHLYSHRQQHEEAMREFRNALETGYNTSSPLMMTVMELQVLSQPVMQLILLKKLVEELTNKSGNEDLNLMKIWTLEDHCLTSMYKKFNVILPEALYILARHAYVIEHYSLSLEMYLNLLSSTKKGCLLEYNRENRLFPLPTTRVITHETILAHLQCGNLTEAEQLCIHEIDDYFPSGSHFKEKAQRNKCTGFDLDSILFSMDEDVLALVLLADIKICQQNYSSAIDYLDRCSNAITRHSILQNQSEIKSSDMNTIFLRYVLGRIYLRKARVSEMNNEVSDTFHYYKRAAMYAPGDEEIISKYKSWLISNNRSESVTLMQENNFLFAELENITVRYILTYNTDKIIPISAKKAYVKEEELSNEKMNIKEEHFIADVGDLFD